MRKYLMLALLLGMGFLYLGADDFPLRPVDQLILSSIHIRTADDCELVFWSDLKAGDSNIYCQKLNANGQEILESDWEVVSHAGDQRLMGAVKSSDNNVVILFEEYDVYGRTGLRLQKISSNGQRLWLEHGVPVSNQLLGTTSLKMVANAIGGVFLVFHGAGTHSIYLQNIDSWGNQLYPEAGLQLFTVDSYLFLRAAIKDGAGGMILMYKEFHQDSPGCRLVRISATGSIVGAHPLIPGDSFPAEDFEIAASTPGQYILWCRTNNPSSFIFHRIDASGNFLIHDPVTITMTLPGSWAYPLNVYFEPNGGVLTTWREPASWDHNLLRVQKYDDEFKPVWQEGGVVLCDDINTSIKVSAAGHQNGNSWFSWYPENGDDLCRAQVLDPNGQALWQEGGIVVAEAPVLPQVLPFPGQGIFLWGEYDKPLQSIRRQVIGTNGACYLTPFGEPLAEAVNGLASLYVTLPMNSRYFSAWSVNRPTIKCYYQITGQNMENLLEEYGRELNPESDEHEYYISLKRLADGTIAILYLAMDPADANMQGWVYLQIVDESGQRLLPGKGIGIMDSDYYSIDCRMGVWGNDIYIAWKEYLQGSGGIIRAQRIQGGQKLWEEEGRIVLTDQTGQGLNLVDIQGNYFIWKTDGRSSVTEVMVLKIDDNGDPAPGWAGTGLRLIEDSGAYHKVFQESGLVGEDLVVLVKLSKPGVYPNMVQKISSTGLRLWQESGVEMLTPLPSASVLDVHYGEELAVIYESTLDSHETLYLQMFSANGELMLDPETSPVENRFDYIEDAQICQLANGHYLCTFAGINGNYIHGSDLYYRFISPQGSLLGNESLLLCGERNKQMGIQMANVGNQAMIAWNDDRAGFLDIDAYYNGIWATSLSGSFLDINEPEQILPAALSLESNYPNPFNRQTRLDYCLKTPGAIQLKVYNSKGQLVRTLKSGFQAKGEHTCTWDGTDNQGRALGSGVYFLRLSGEQGTATRKLLLLR